MCNQSADSQAAEDQHGASFGLQATLCRRTVFLYLGQNISRRHVFVIVISEHKLQVNLGGFPDIDAL